MITTAVYVQGADLPDLAITWNDQNDDLRDFSSGWTFSLKVGDPGSAALFTKASGITGAATDPNVTIAWATSGELNTLATGSHTGQITATRTSDSKQLIRTFPISIKPPIT